jgi:UDP-glucose 4-epimerase
MTPDRVLVTGGCGFVGSRLVRKLLERGDDVSVVDDLGLGGPENLGDARESVEIAQIDIRDADATARAFRQLRPHHVIHLAAIHFIPACDRDPKRCVDVNVGGTQSVLEACAGVPVASIALASTAAVYAPADTAHHEGSALGPTDIYGLSKLFSEQLGELFSRRTGIPTGVARLFNVFGPGETNPHLIPAVIVQSGEGAQLRLGNLTTKRDYVFVDDVAEALAALPAAAERAGSITCNIGTGTERDGQQIVAAIGELMGRPLEIAVDPGRMRASDRPHLLSDSSRAAELLGWHSTTDLAAGLDAAFREPMAASVAGTPV